MVHPTDPREQVAVTGALALSVQFILLFLQELLEGSLNVGPDYRNAPEMFAIRS